MEQLKGGGLSKKQVSGNSSVGRAPDCRGFAAIRRSMVRIRVAGLLFVVFISLMEQVDLANTNISK